jgi:hypothetical protein
MRFFLIVTLFIYALSSSAQDTLYVYAKSGLTMRATGSTAGEKVSVVPFGAAVVTTGRYSDSVSVAELAAVNHPDSKNPTKPLTLRAPYQEVTVAGETGFVFAGYLSRYAPDTTSSQVNTRSWLHARKGMLDTLADGRNRNAEIRMLVHAEGGICYRQGYVDGGTSATLILPSGTLNEGYLIANHLYDLEAYTHWEEPEMEGFYDSVYLLTDIKQNALVFSGYNGVVTITVVNGMVIIYQDWSC